MAYLTPLDPADENDFTKDCWMLSTGPFGVTGFCMDGTEAGKYCYVCGVEKADSTEMHFHLKTRKHDKNVELQLSEIMKSKIGSSFDEDNDGPDSLFLNNYCKVCKVTLNSKEEQESHYLGEKHQKKVQNYFLMKVNIVKSNDCDIDKEKTEIMSKKSKVRYCDLCKIELSSPVAAQDHYSGKKHAKKLREEMYTATPNAKKLTEMVNSTGDSYSEAKESVRKRKQEIEAMLQVEDAKRACLAKELENIRRLEGQI